MALTDVNGKPVTLTKLTAVPEAPAPADAPPTAPRPRRAVRAARRVRLVATHDRTQRLGRFVARHPAYLAAGTAVVARRAWDGRTAARYERMLRAAEAIGQHELAQEWEARGTAYRAARHRRRMELLAAPIHLARATAVATMLGTGTLLAVGIVMAIAEHQVRDVLVPITGFVDTVAWLCAVIAVLWEPLFIAAPFVAVAALWGVGRRHGSAPAWVMPDRQRRGNDGAPVTPSVIVTALRDLGIAPLRKAIREMGDAGAAMLGPITIAGCGVEVDVLLPSGVTTDEVMNRRRKLAENIGRHEHEVFVTVAQAARTVNLWIADSGALDEPIGPSPLTFDTSVTGDYKSGRAPWGQDLRGDATSLSLYQRHLLATGLSNQGKALALDTPIPTPSGWTTMDALKVGDQVFGMDGKPCNVIAAHEVMYDHQCYEVEFNDGTIIVADAEHLWYTETAISRRSERSQNGRSGPLAPRGTDQQSKRERHSVKTTEQIAATVRHQTATRDEANHSIPVAAPLGLPPRDLPIDPYTLGIWLGDGCNASGRITLNRLDSPEIIARLEDGGHPIPSDDRPGCIGYLVPNLTKRLRILRVLRNKHIPTEYLRASEAQRRALLAGLMDSDGTIDATGSAEFAVCTKALADGAAELIQSLGYRVRRCEQRVNGRTEETSTSFRTAFTPSEPVFHLRRKNARVQVGERRPKSARRYIVAVRPVESVPVRCIGVDSQDHLFLASEAFIATHNTASLRALALWLVLDPTVEFRIGDLKGVGDWNMFLGLATVLIEGPRDEDVIAVTEMLEEGVREMERRILAPAGTKFPPLVLLVDEAQVAFMCPAKGEDGRQYGGTKATSRYFMAARKIHNQGRAVNVTLWQGTQDPTDQNLPKLVREGAHIRASLVLGTEAQARMALGDKAIDGGAAPHKLRQDIDKGTLVVSGSGMQLPPGQSSLTIRTHFIDDGQAAEIAERAKAIRSGVTTRAVEPVEDVDHMADIAAVLGEEPRLRTPEVLQRLIERNPGEYREWTFVDLTSVLRDAGAEPHRYDGYPVVDRQKILNILAQRAQDAEDDQG